MKKQAASEEQIALFEAIRPKASRQGLAADISNLLEVSIDPAYKRISGKIHLTLPELKLIRDRFGISIDRLLDGYPETGIKTYSAPMDILNMEDYHEFLKKQVNRLGALNMPGMEFLYSAHDFPLDRACLYPELILFHIYAGKDSLHQPGMSYAAFCNSLDREQVMSLYRQLHDYSVQIPSTEIWHNQTVDRILNRIKYFHDSGAFGHSDIPLRLLSQIQELLNTVHQHAISGFQDADGKVPFRMYVCAVDPDYDILLALKDTHPYYVITPVLNNHFGTFDQTLCNGARQWMDDLKVKSIRISGSSAFREKEQFFRSAKAKIDHLANEITRNNKIFS
jgi:hypothetical protein